jgi:hypothetical protein
MSRYSAAAGFCIDAGQTRDSEGAKFGCKRAAAASSHEEPQHVRGAVAARQDDILKQIKSKISDGAHANGEAKAAGLAQREQCTHKQDGRAHGSILTCD